MNTLFDLLEFNRERTSRHIATSDRGWWVAGAAAATVFVLFAVCAALASATPSTTFWAPSTALCQAAGVPHITYDTYFGKGPAAGSQGAPNYPIDTGLTIGLIPSTKVQAEAGFDVLLPSQDPLFLNAKLCTPESSLFEGSPAISGGIYSVGTKKGSTDYNVLHLMVQKAMPIGGYVSAGVYHGLSKTLFTNSEGNVVQTGAMLAIVSPDVPVGLKGLKKVNFIADAQTGKNVFGAWGAGTTIYVADNASLIVGPVFFLDKALQPGGKDVLWTVQLDVDVPLGK